MGGANCQRSLWPIVLRRGTLRLGFDHGLGWLVRVAAIALSPCHAGRNDRGPIPAGSPIRSHFRPSAARYSRFGDRARADGDADSTHHRPEKQAERTGRAYRPHRNFA